MSQLASFTELDLKALQLLIPAALPRKRLFRKPVYVFQDYLDQHGKDLGGFDADGLYIVIVLLYLREFQGINLLDANSGLALTARSLTKHQGSFFTFFTDEDRDLHTIVRSCEFDTVKLQKLCETEGIDFELYSHTGTLKAAGARIADILAAIPDDHVVLYSAG